MNDSLGRAGSRTTGVLNLIRPAVSMALAVLLVCCCSGRDPGKASPNDPSTPPGATPANPGNQAYIRAHTRPAGVKLIYVTVALCDNVHQGIVPVPARLGNGDDPDSNLYWGAAFGVKSSSPTPRAGISFSKSIVPSPACSRDASFNTKPTTHISSPTHTRE